MTEEEKIEQLEAELARLKSDHQQLCHNHRVVLDKALMLAQENKHLKRLLRCIRGYVDGAPLGDTDLPKIIANQKPVACEKN